MKVYIAGQITGRKDYRKYFDEAEKRLVALGYEVVNPAKNEANSYRGYIDKGLQQLMSCDAIYLLRGWRKSRGAILERQYAMVCDLFIMEEVCEDGKRVRKCSKCGD